MPNSPSLGGLYSVTDEPLSIDQVKNYLKITGNDDHTLIEELIRVVRCSAETYLKTSILDQCWQLTYQTYTPTVVKLPMGPVRNVHRVMVFGRDESATKISPDVYYLNAEKNKLIFDANVIGSKIQITYTAGYGKQPCDVPDAITEGMLSHIAAIYDGRSGANIVPAQSQALYDPYKQVSYG